MERFSFSGEEKAMQAETEAGVARDLSAEERAMFEELFGVDPERDVDEIKGMMRLIRKDKKGGRIGSEWDYKKDKKSGRLKYTDEQIEAGQWEKDDLDFVIEQLRRERIERYFGEVARRYEETRPIPDSIVRLDQEKKIAEDLRGGSPVLIRGSWRIGKTSMAMSLASHQFGAESFYIDLGTRSGEGESPEDFRKNFGLYPIARYIAKKEFPDSENIFEKEDEIIKQIENSQKSPFEFLNDYLLKNGEKVFLFLDEVISLAEQPTKMRYLAELKDLSQIRIAIVLHRVASFEYSFQQIFEGYKTHFIRPLTVEEVGRLVRTPLEGTQITFTDEAIQRIYEFTGGRPMEINNICRALMDPLSKHKNHRFIYRAKDIDALTNQPIRELREIFEVAIKNYMRVYELLMNEEEREIIKRLIKEGEVPTSEIDPDKIQPLIDTTFVTRDEKKGVYRINGQLFKRILLEELRILLEEPNP